MKKIISLHVFIFIVFSITHAKTLTNNITEVFTSFCEEMGYQHLQEKIIKQKVNEKKGLIELIKNCEIVQFGRFKTLNGNDLYVFANYKNPDCAYLLIDQGCYTYVNGVWAEQKNILPNINLLTLYGNDQKLPNGYENIGKTRVEINNKTTVTYILEPNWVGQDDKKERILSQYKFTAVQLKWSKRQHRFKIKKWIR